MNEDPQFRQTQLAHQKMTDATYLVEASLAKLVPYDAERTYTPDEREPYDALCDRFIRATEVSIKFFRSYERLQYAENSETLRDLLNRMAKLELVTSVELWFRMRDVRNRIVHDDLPTQIKQMYDDIMHIYGPELIRAAKREFDAALGL